MNQFTEMLPVCLGRIREGREARELEINEKGTTSISLERYKAEGARLYDDLDLLGKRVSYDMFLALLGASLVDYEIVGGEG